MDSSGATGKGHWACSDSQDRAGTLDGAEGLGGEGALDGAGAAGGCFLRQFGDTCRKFFFDFGVSEGAGALERARTIGGIGDIGR